MSSVPSSFALPERILLGPGPSPVPAAVLGALARPTIGHLDPEFLRLMDEVRDMLRAVFGTQNPCTLPMSGTGSAGMETAIVNVVEPGSKVLVGLNGVFSTRLADVARRAGAEVTAVEVEWGRSVDADVLKKAAQGRKFDVLATIHAETSTGVLQPLAPLRARLARDSGIDDLALDRPLEGRGVRLVRIGAGAVGEAVAEGEHDRARVQLLELVLRAAATGNERTNEKGGESPHRPDFKEMGSG